jgi:hypothetical protein
MLIKKSAVLLSAFVSLFYFHIQAQVNYFNWDIERKDKGSLMFLDVPYNTESLNYLSLTVAKAKKIKRPSFMSIVFPSNLDRQKGIELVFVNNIGDSTNIFPMRTGFTEFDKISYGVRFINGYSKDGNDIFSCFLKHKYVIFTFFTKANSKTIIVPIEEFKSIYSTLE